MGRAISVVVSGLFVSTALGVPLGTLVGQVLGWRGSFTAVAVLSVVALIATLMLIPSMPSTGGGAGSQAKYAFAPRVLAALVVNVVAFAAVYSALTYIVPFLESVTGISGALISLFLLAYGVATAVGSFAASSAVITGLIIAVISIPVAWAASFLKPPVIADATELPAATV
jgi:MFS transporter, DHA1 family, inner membrane transport protein